jgi:hypothetical protein
MKSNGVVTRLVMAPLLLGVAVLVSGCRWLPWQHDRYDGPGSQISYLMTGTGSSRELDYTLRLDGTPVDVYFAFVNYESSGTAAPTVDAPWVPESSVTGRSPATTTAAATGPILDPPEVTDFNNNPPRPGSAAARTLSVYGPAGSGEAALAPGEYYSIPPNFNPAAMTVIDTTLVFTETDQNGITLNVRLADNWDDVAGTGLSITPAMAQALGQQFLTPGSDNDIYDWATAFLGVPWFDWGTGSSAEWTDAGYPELVSPLDVGNTIDILLLDIEEDGSTDGGVVGLFWAKDNYYQSSIGVSNERIMFYLDAPMFSQADGGGWDITDFWPATMVSTLAHEFQHMIHFYQKNVLRMEIGSTETWLNELLSLVTEDLLSDRMQVPGPRGVDPSLYPDGDAGSPGNLDGRVPSYNNHSDTGIFQWSSTDPLTSYGMAYSFGSFLIRNYGGPSLVHEILTNPESGTGAIEFAFDATGTDMSVRRALAQWAASVLVSNEVRDDATIPYYETTVNSGDWFEFTYDGGPVRLGSINYYNYPCATCSRGSGPLVYTSSPPGVGSTIDPGSVTYLLAGESLTQTSQWHITIGPHTDLVVVVRPTGM